MKFMKKYLAVPIFTALLFYGCSNAKIDSNAIVIMEQGSFMAGGVVIQNEGAFDNNAFNNFMPVVKGQSYHGDHAYVSYQIPEKPKALSLVFLHGAGQSAKSWETTPDGRDGFNNIFLRKKFSVYLIDQPRRGRAGRSTVSGVVEPLADEQMWYDIWRYGSLA